jgi:hypothetical protein
VKSTLYSGTDIAGFGPSVWIINPDLPAYRLHIQENLSPDRANIEALIRIEAWLEASLAAHQTVGVGNGPVDGQVPQTGRAG